MEQEKRSYRRYNALISPLSCSKCDCENLRVDISNISCDGMGISINANLTEGDTVKLEIILPDDDIPMFIVGEVAWATKHPAMEKVYSAGLRLIRISNCDRERLMKYINVSFLCSH
ncbi:MAG: PilZ domain-containing protein [Candidatus Omnitrophota bacterium]|nr:PilZ domain-containing protein [Candidatus Omnitrophota bacterium]